MLQTLTVHLFGKPIGILHQMQFVKTKYIAIFALRNFRNEKKRKTWSGIFTKEIMSLRIVFLPFFHYFYRINKVDAHESTEIPYRHTKF